MRGPSAAEMAPLIAAAAARASAANAAATAWNGSLGGALAAAAELLAGPGAGVRWRRPVVGLHEVPHRPATFCCVPCLRTPRSWIQ